MLPTMDAKKPSNRLTTRVTPPALHKPVWRPDPVAYAALEGSPDPRMRNLAKLAKEVLG
jgi:hypothetical protein